MWNSRFYPVGIELPAISLICFFVVEYQDVALTVIMNNPVSGCRMINNKNPGILQTTFQIHIREIFHGIFTGVHSQMFPKRDYFSSQTICINIPRDHNRINIISHLIVVIRIPTGRVIHAGKFQGTIRGQDAGCFNHSSSGEVVMFLIGPFNLEYMHLFVRFKRQGIPSEIIFTGMIKEVVCTIVIESELVFSIERLINKLHQYHCYTFLNTSIINNCISSHTGFEPVI